ncbi:helix-turn-helix domain-containing protein [Tumebacillus flagellatus]|uniref:HTH cro/C1-type domain-containing protein n=1 Tax=Tumebacillus flagellatus TaxID=1157490 RepID=A0A074LGN5_9BACL|nr:helix-turn-helix transcriptional regulator [Tumebacillus flagellatus]KEO81396.1 hypothetical protein EL26_20895 [Tumebacillus flagellatus]
MSNTETLGQRIRACRLRKGLTQTELAKGIVTPSMLSQVESERANPSHYVLQKIAERLEVPLEDLLENTTSNLNFISRFQMAKAMIANEQYSGALQLLYELAEESSVRIEPFEVAYNLVFCLIQLEMLEEAKHRLDQLSNQVRWLAGVTTHFRLHYLYGVYEMHRRCYPLAEYHFLQVLNDPNVSSMTDKKFLASIQMDLGKAQQRQGKLQESLKTFHQTSETLQYLDNLKELGDLYLEMAKTCLQSQQLEESVQFASRAVLCSETAQNAFQQLMTKMSVAVIRASTGNTAGVEQELRQIADDLLNMKKPVEAGIALAELSKVQVEHGKLDQAFDTSQGAKNLLPSNHEHFALALRVQAKIAQARNQIDFASKLFKQSADCYKLVGCFNEYEQTMKELSAHFAKFNDPLRAYHTISEMLECNSKTRESRGIVL